MRRLFVLRPEASFDAVSEVMEELGYELTRLEGCAFPSRPEAKVATWTLVRQPAARYRYEPDIELRWLAVDHIDREATVEQLDSTELFDDWHALGEALESGDWNRVFRAAAAFRVAAELRESGVDGESTLISSLEDGRPFTVRAAASQLAQIASPDYEERIRAVRDATDDLETRVDLKRALDRIEMQRFKRR